MARGAKGRKRKQRKLTAEKRAAIARKIESFDPGARITDVRAPGLPPITWLGLV